MPSLTTVSLDKKYAFQFKKTVHTKSPSSSPPSSLDITPALQQYLSFPLSSTNCSSCHFSALSPSTPIRRFHYTPSETLFTHFTIIVFLALILSIHPLRFIPQIHSHMLDYPPPIAHSHLYNLYSVELPKTAIEREIHAPYPFLSKQTHHTNEEQLALVSHTTPHLLPLPLHSPHHTSQ